MNEDDNLNTRAKKAGIWYTVANILLKGCIFLTLPLFTRILTTSDFGIYNSYVAYEQLLQAILGLGLYGTVKNAKLDFEKDFNQYISSVLFLSLIFLEIALLLINATYSLLKETIGFNRFVTNCLILQSFGSYLIYFYGAKLNIEFKYKSYIVISCFNTILNITISVFLIIFVFPNERYMGRILGSAIPLLIIAIMICCTIVKKGCTGYKLEYWKYALTIGLPLIPHVVSQSLLSQFDRIMIRNMVGNSQSGIYSYIYTICTITFVICISLDNAWTPWVYMKLKNKEQREVKHAGNYYVFLFAVLSIGFICLMPEITKLIASKEYCEGVELLIPLSLANYCVFLYMLPVGIEYYNKKTNFISLGTISAALLNLFLNYIAIQLWGYKAAAYTTLVSYVALFILHVIIAKQFDFIEIYDLKTIIQITMGVFAIATIILLLNNFDFIGIAFRYITIMFIVILIAVKRKQISYIIRGGRT